MPHDLTEVRIRKYMDMRKTEGAGPRTVNAEVGIGAGHVRRSPPQEIPKVKANPALWPLRRLSKLLI
jgi:hypothetical protein